MKGLAGGWLGVLLRGDTCTDKERIEVLYDIVNIVEAAIIRLEQRVYGVHKGYFGDEDT